MYSVFGELNEGPAGKDKTAGSAGANVIASEFQHEHGEYLVRPVKPHVGQAWRRAYQRRQIVTRPVAFAKC